MAGINGVSMSSKGWPQQRSARCAPPADCVVRSPTLCSPYKAFILLHELDEDEEMEEDEDLVLQLIRKMIRIARSACRVGEGGRGDCLAAFIGPLRFERSMM